MDLLTFLRAQGDRVAGVGCIAGGAALLVTGAIQISRSRTILSQLSYLGSAALIGLFLLVLGIGLLVTARLRDEWRKLDEIQSVLEARAGAAPADQATPRGDTDIRDLAEKAPAASIRALR